MVWWSQANAVVILIAGWCGLALVWWWQWCSINLYVSLLNSINLDHDTITSTIHIHDQSVSSESVVSEPVSSSELLLVYKVCVVPVSEYFSLAPGIHGPTTTFPADAADDASV